jgi:hypothetical protein
MAGKRELGKLRGNLVCLGLALLTTLAGCSPEAVGSGLSLGAANLLLDEVERSAEDMTNTLSTALDGSVNNFSTQLLTGSYTLRSDLESTLRTGDELLTRQQEELVLRLLALRDAADSSVAAGFGEAERLTANFAQFVSDLPGTSNEPRVTRVHATPIVPGWTEAVKVVLSGTNLDSPENRLAFGEVSLAPLEATATAATFIVPNEHLATLLDPGPEVIQQLRGQAHLHYREGLFRRKRTKSQPLAVTSVPRSIGHAVIIFSSSASTENTRTVSTHVCSQTVRGPGASGRVRVASTSCQFNVPTMPVGCGGAEQQGTIVGTPRLRTVSNRHGGGARITSLGPRSFTVEVTARSDRGPWKGGGSYAVVADYEVAFPCAVAKRERSEPLPIVIGEEVLFSVPTDREATFEGVEMTMLDSTRHVLSGPRDANRLVSMENTGSRVILRPMRLERNP